MKVLSNVKKPQFEVKGKKLFIRYSENQLNEFGTSVPAYEPDIERIEDSENYSYQQIAIDKNSDRKQIIAAIINDRYDTDSQIAILSNSDNTAEHLSELQTFQKFRNFAKKLTDDIEKIQ